MQKEEAIFKPELFLFSISKLKCLPGFCHEVQILGVFIGVVQTSPDICVWLILLGSL